MDLRVRQTSRPGPVYGAGMSRLASRLAAVVAAGSSVFAPACAFADRVDVVDQAGDVQRLDWERSTKNHPMFLPAPAETSVDVVRTVVVHRQRALDVTIRFRDLVRLTDHETSVRVVTPTGDRYDVRLEARPSNRTRVIMTRDDRAFSCLDMDAAVERSRDRVDLSIPTACLEVPEWVRVGVTVEGLEDTPSVEHPYDFEMYLDDAWRANLGKFVQPTLSDRVHRG
jgi:hypothetical protein